MMKRRIGMTLGLAGGVALVALGGCETTAASAPVEVTRFHLGPQLERGTIAVEPVPNAVTSTLEAQSYADAVQREVLASGYTAAMPGQYVAAVAVTRASRPGPPRSSGVSIGLGGGGYSGGYGGGVGLGGGVSFPIGKRRSHDIVYTDLSVQIRRRSDSTVIWEGHAQTAADSSAPDAQPDATARKLASALFRGFPGESGRTITVK